MCNVINQEPICSCFEGYTGNPSHECHKPPFGPIVQEYDPCDPDPCGPYSQKRKRNGYCSCSCLPGYRGTPPGCRPECEIDPDCPQNKACRDLKCIDPCVEKNCGRRADCRTVNHVATCYCKHTFTGDPNSEKGCHKIEGAESIMQIITNRTVGLHLLSSIFLHFSHY